MAPGVTTLAAVRNLAKFKADMVNGSFITDAEWNIYIQLSHQELYDLLVQKYGNEYFYTSTTITTDGTNEAFALPADFYKLLGVDVQLDGAAGATNGSYATLKPFSFQERNRYSVPNFMTRFGVTNLRYRLRGNNLYLTPIPAANQTIRVHYIPRLTIVVNDTDTLDMVSGWEEYIALDAAIKALIKEESDPSAVMAQKQAMLVRIEAAAENRDAGNPATVADSLGASYGYPQGGYFGGGGGIL